MRRIQLGFLMAALLGVAGCGETETSGTGGISGTGGSGDQHPVDQCSNDADQAIYDELGADGVGDVAADCPLMACGGPIGTIIGGDTSETAKTALADCIAQCISDETGLSAGCTNCYGLITACAVGTCLEPCAPPNQGSAECAACSTENCDFFDACLGI